MYNTIYFPDREGGAEKSVQNICESLVAHGHNVEVISISKNNVFENFEHGGVRISKVPILNIYSHFNFKKIKPNIFKKLLWQCIDIFNVFEYFRSLKILRNKKVDLIWTNNLSGFSPSVWLSAKHLNIPVVHTTRDYYLINNNVQLFSKEGEIIRKPNLISRIRISIAKRLSKNLAAMTFISHFIHEKHKYLLNLSSEKCFVIYNSISRASIVTEPRRVLEDFDKLNFGFIGQITQSKGLDLILEPFTKSLSEHRLLIAGKPNHELSIPEDDRILQLGFVDAHSFFDSIDVLFVPSRWEEPFGRVVIESVARGVPVIASDKGALPELAEIFDGVTTVNFSRLDLSKISTPKITPKDIRVLSEDFCNEEIYKNYLKLFLSVL